VNIGSVEKREGFPGEKSEKKKTAEKRGEGENHGPEKTKKKKRPPSQKWAGLREERTGRSGRSKRKKKFLIGSSEGKPRCKKTKTIGENL